MNKRLMTSLLAISLSGSLVLTGCATGKEESAEVVEKAPPDVIQLDPKATAGFVATTVQSRSVSGQVVTTGEVKANENKVFHINSFVAGRVVRDTAFLGDTIHQGETLAVVQNLEVARIQADYIHELHQNEIEISKARTRYALAQKNLEREKRLLAEGISPKKDYLQAQSDAALTQADLEGAEEHNVHIKSEAKALLGAYGMKPGSSHSETIRTGSPIVAPRAGVVTQKNITLGEMVTPDTVMYEVADLSQVWLDLTLYPQDLATIHPGQAVRFTSDSLPHQTFLGRINYLQPAADESSRTFVARAYLNNPQGSLKPGMLGQARIEQTSRQMKPFVPEEAVQKYGRETFVFEVLGPGKYRKQDVQLGEKVAGGYLINAGIQPGTAIVGKGSFTLKAEMLKGQFAEEE